MGSKGIVNKGRINHFDSGEWIEVGRLEGSSLSSGLQPRYQGLSGHH